MLLEYMSFLIDIWSCNVTFIKVRLREDDDSGAREMQLSGPKTSQPVSEDVVLRALREVVDATKYPILITDIYGKHRTGTVVACLRKLQRWNLTSIFEEYRRFAGHKRRPQNEQFIELFDIDQVHVPPRAPAFLPSSSDSMAGESVADKNHNRNSSTLDTRTFLSK